LGEGFEWARAELVVDLAVTLAEAVVSPLPAAARPIVLTAAVRAYTNPEGVDSLTVGATNRTFRNATVYLTDKERAELQRLGDARTLRGAFTINGQGSARTYPVDAT
jgi:hypothetical protein